MPESSAHPQPSQSVRPKPTPGPIPGQMEHMAQMLAEALQQPRESGISIERNRKLGAKPYDGSGDPERALSWIEANEEIFQMMGDECLKHSDYTRVSLALSHCFSIIYIVLGVRSLI